MTRPGTPAWTALESRLRSIEQGDLLSWGAVAIAVKPGSAIAALAGLREDVEVPDVVTLTVETASGWYAVLTQDCDVVRSVDDEPCLNVAPVVYIPDDQWQRLHLGPTSYRMFPLPERGVAPVDGQHAARIPAGHKPVVDIRYVGTLDKTALTDVEQRHVLVGHDKIRFQEWVGARFARESFADAVHDTVLPAARAALDDALKAALAGGTEPQHRLVCSVVEYYVRSSDRYLEVLCRLDGVRGRKAGLLRKAQGTVTWNATALNAGAKALSGQANAAHRGSGYLLKFVTADFTELSAAEFETYALWHVQDEPPAPPPASVEPDDT